MPRQTIDLAEEIDETRNDIAKRNGITTAAAMRRTFALLVVADRRNRRFFSPLSGKERRTFEAGCLMGVGSGAREDVNLVKVFATGGAFPSVKESAALCIREPSSNCRLFTRLLCRSYFRLGLRLVSSSS